jgi:midasin (ATPase involved in ribosome maturation)
MAKETKDATPLRVGTNPNEIIGLEDEKKVLELCIKHNLPALLIGETGVGKTYLVVSEAKKIGKRCVRVSVNGELGINEIVGKWLVKNGSTYWQDGILVECMRRGDWIILDEINVAQPEIWMCINSVLDDSRSIILSEKDGELVVPHPDFRVFATMNPSEGYAGTKEMNPALMSRFKVVMKLGYYDPYVELEILKYQTDIDDNIGRMIIDVGNAIRKLKLDQQILYPCGTRDLVNWAILLACNGNSLAETFKYSVMNKCSDDDARAIAEVAKRALKVEINWNSSKEKIITSLTSDLVKDIETLKAKKRDLVKSVDDLQAKVAQVKEQINT